VTVVDRNGRGTARIEEELDAILDAQIAKWGLTESEKKVLLSRITFSSRREDLAEVPVVIEAIPDLLDAKREIMAQLGEICLPETIFATNTSTLSITEIASASGRSDRVIGMHFMYPATWSPIVEVVRGMDTSEATLEQAKVVARRLGKEIIEVFESPGYVTTRAILPMLNEAMYLVMEGVASAEDVDKALRLGYQFKMGPLEYCDRIGLDKVLNWMEHLFREMGDVKYRPCPLLRKLVRSGRLGRRTGQGFFTYEDDRRSDQGGMWR